TKRSNAVNVAEDIPEELVCLVGGGGNQRGKISSNGAELKLMACDQKIVNVTLDAPLDEQLQGAVEVIGKVERNCSLSSQRIIPYNDDFDLELYGEAITMATDFPDIFGSTQSNGLATNKTGE
ncbi:60S acidic ribosomal protein P1-alpha 3, partial [Desmophyllum pertusum]